MESRQDQPRSSARALRVKAAAKPADAQMDGSKPRAYQADHDGSAQSGGRDVDFLAENQGVIPASYRG